MESLLSLINPITLFLILLFTVLINYFRTKIPHYLVLSLSILFTIFGIIFDTFARISIIELVAKNYFKYAAMSFTVATFLFTLFLIDSSKMEEKTLFYIVISSLFGIELYDVLKFKIIVTKINSSFQLVAPRSFIGYFARTIQLGIGLTVFIIAATRFIKKSKYRKRKIMVVFILITFSAILAMAGIYPLIQYGAFSLKVQVIGITTSITLLAILITIDPYLLVIWGGELRAILVFDKNGFNLFKDFAEEKYEVLATNLLTAIPEIREYILLNKRNRIKKIDIEDNTLEIYTHESIYAVVLHRKLPEKFKIFIKKFLVKIHETMSNNIQENIESKNLSQIQKKIKRIYEREILRKIY